MNLKRNDGWLRLMLARLWPMVVFLAALTITGCEPWSAPTPTPLPTSTPTPIDPLSLVSPEVRGYLLLVRPVTTDYAILHAREQPASVLEALVEELKLADPPQDMAEAHAFLEEGYRLLAEGTAILETGPKPELRSEAIFIQDWGVRQLWEHRRVVVEYLAQVEREHK